MNDKKFEVIEGRKDVEDMLAPIKWERADKGQKIMSLHPMAMCAFISERRLRYIVEGLKNNPNIRVTYNVFDEQEKERDQRIDELKEMFQDDDTIVVLDPRERQR